jgi:V-type H+-transporting ATPase 16kDa proteolipid subunit
VKPHDYSLFAGFVHLGAGVACGATGLAAGYAIGHIGDAVIIPFSDNGLFTKPRNQCVRAYVHESKVFVSMVLILIFAEVLGLYG